jgi:hypothetical protein
MDQLDFDNAEFKEDLISDTGDFISEAGDAYNTEEAATKSGNKIIAPLLLIGGFLLCATGAYLSNVYTYILCFVSLLLGYYIFSEKNKAKTTYKYNKLSRIFGVILVAATVSIIVLTKYEVI